MTGLHRKGLASRSERGVVYGGGFTGSECGRGLLVIWCQKIVPWGGGQQRRHREGSCGALVEKKRPRTEKRIHEHLAVHQHPNERLYEHVNDLAKARQGCVIEKQDTSRRARQKRETTAGLKNNTCNKSTFPVRIHPHLQSAHHHHHHQHQHQNASTSPAAFINSSPAVNGSSSSSTWLFPAAGAHGNMQDEMLGSEKPKVQQQELEESPDKQQQISPGHQESGILPELDKACVDESTVERGSSDGSNGKEKLRLESPVLTAFDYQEPSILGTAPQSSSTSSLTSFNNWSAAIPTTPSTIINEDMGFFNPAASANNSPLLFQNFSHHVSPGFGGNFSPQIGPISQHHPPHSHFQHPHNQHQQHRRSPASPHPPPFPHRSAFGQLQHLSNNLSKPPSPWGSYQSPSPSPSSTSWSPGGGYGGWGGSQGREFRRGINGGMTPLNSISPLKKNFPNNHLAQQKYSKGCDGARVVMKRVVMEQLVLVIMALSCLCFAPQDRPRTFDGFNMHSLENSLIDIMRAEQDSLK
ncbi:hypothetical protein DNTS_004733, partial [Danionella cerebrum]